MIKKSLSLILIFIITFSLFGCHGAKETIAFSVPEALDVNKNYEITFWAKNDTNKFQTEIYQNAINNFEKLYPNININMRLYTDYNSIYNDVITNIATDTTPNVCITYPDHIATYLTGKDTVVPLNELIDDEKYGLKGTDILFDSPSKDEVVPEFLNECYFGDTCYALPFMRSTEACYINNDFIEKLGFTLPDVLTWDFVWRVSEKAMEKDAKGNYKLNGQKVLIPVIYKSTDNMLITMLKQKNAGYSDNDGNNLMFNDVTKDILFKIADEANKKTFSTFKISGYPGNFLNAGQCIFAIDSTAGATWMGADAPNMDISADKIKDFDIRLSIIPQLDENNIKMISQGPSVCLFNKKDPGEVLASWLFMQYLITDDVQISYSETEGYIPVTNKALKNETYQKYLENCGADNGLHYNVKIKASELLLDNINNTFVTPVFNGSVSLRNAAGELIEDVTKSVRRKVKTDDKYIENLYGKVASLYRLDQLSAVSGKISLGELPKESKLLLSGLGTVWGGLVIIFAIKYVKNKKNKSHNQ